MTHDVFAAFLERHRLSGQYLHKAEKHFAPLLSHIRSRKQEGQPLLVGINGCQGSGKSTLADYLQLYLSEKYHFRVCNLSLDDFYLTKEAREKLARDTHPLLVVRGVPGTHDIGLANHVIATLLAGKEGSINIPRFNKATDDRRPDEECNTQPLPVDMIIFEGWCVGATPQKEDELVEPCNALEAEEDTDGRWRRYVNRQLEEHYQALFGKIDIMVMLKAPGFACVHRWRTEQEQKLAKMLQEKSGEGVNSGLMSEMQIARFVQFYQRITEHLLATLPDKTDHLYLLDKHRNIIDEKHSSLPSDKSA